MAVKIKLPGVGGGKAKIPLPSRGVARRAGGAVSLSGGDVPIVAPASDPGLTVPPPVDIAGDTFKALGETFDEFAEVAERARTRTDAVERARATSAFNESLAAELRRIQTEEDLSSEEAARTFIQGGQVALREAVDAHPGSTDSKARLTIRLEAIRSGYADRVSLLSAQAGLARVGETMGTVLNQLSASVRDDPGSLPQAFDALDATIEDMAPALTVEQELDFQSSGREAIVATAVEGFLDRGMFLEAKELMQGTPGLIEAMSPETQRGLSTRIATFLRAQAEAETAGLRKVEEATQILGHRPNAAQRAKLAGVAPSTGRQTATEKIEEIEEALDIKLTARQRANVVGLETPQAVSPEGKVVQDREMFISQFGEGSEQVAAFDESVRDAGKPSSMSDVAGQRKEFTKASGEFVDVRNSFARVVASVQDPTPAGDLALIFNFMKVLDPASVVRESEFAQAAATGSFGQRLQAAAERFLAGKRLTDVQRADFADRAELLMLKQVGFQLQLEALFKGIAQRAGFNPDDVVLDYIGSFRPGGALPASSGEGLPELPKPRFQVDLDGNIVGTQ